MSSKEIQKLKDEIEELKQKNRNQKEAHEKEIQNLEKKNCDLNDNLTIANQRLKKKKIRDQNEAHEDQTQNQEQKNRDQNEAHEDQTQNQEQTNHDQNEAHEDQTQNQEQKNRDQNEAHEDQTQNQEQLLSTQFDNLTVYNRMSLSPVSVEKSQPCKVWWCPIHSMFETFVDKFEASNKEDELVVNRAKDRFRKWKRKGKCCLHDRQNKDRNNFAPPSNWPK
ncbi:transcription factor SPT20 homolog isoform X4 [Metopolophium dirhodum]|uniref:transcription factor SPT20 homolog isoform X4 n=1 Tax=Metopolophium dirhodum TaxID=44670 RepID=UPI00298FBB3A|nr:transcription factor SPT20 homolog isoform X4 [Metopolophium dirhodum]